MSVTFECDKLVNKLRAIGNKDIAVDIVRRLVARGINIAKPLAQATKSDVAAGIIADPLEVSDGGAESGFSINHQLAPYFEYGTGFPGNQGAVSNGQQRNPEAGGFNYTLQTTILSGPNAGKQRRGWVYFKDGRFYTTLGQPARPFMYPAQAALEQEAGEIAGVVVRDAIRG
jgi:hypothetical protein